MKDIRDEINKIIERCDICLNGDIISKESLMQSLIHFMSSTIEKDKHNVSFILHTGSDCFNAIILAFIALSNILYNEETAEDLVSSLEKEDIVLYYNHSGDKAERYKFSKIVKSIDGKYADKGPYAVIIQEKDTSYSSISYVPKALWNRISRYHGKATSLDGKGIRKDSGKRNDFLKTVLGLNDDEITRTVDTSTVIVMSREQANYLIKGLSFKFGRKEISYTELVPTSYYTPSDQQYQYGHSVSKAEPVIKIAGTVSVARKLLLQRGWNKNIGLVILNDDSMKKGESEIPELIKRKSIQYVYLCTNIDSETAHRYMSDLDSYGLYACTKNFLNIYAKQPVVRNSTTLQLSKQINTLINHNIEKKSINGFVGWDSYRDFKRSIHTIKSYDFDSEEKDSFIIQAFSLMNLYMTAAFPIIQLNEKIQQGIIGNVLNTNERISQLIQFSDSLPEHLQSHSVKVIECLIKLNTLLYKQNPKEDALKEILNSNSQKKIVIVVPKAYYITILQNFQNSTNVSFVTANRFSNRTLYDMIIVLGNYVSTRFNPINCKASDKTIMLLYEPENRLLKSKSHKAKDIEREFDKRSTLKINVFDSQNEIFENEDENPEEVEQIEQIEEDVNQFVEEAFSKATFTYFRDSSGRNAEAEVVAIAKFENNEVAFFSKNYVAYVLDEDKREISEVKAENLSDGDTIIFTRRNDKARDVVDEFLKNMIKENRMSESFVEAYRKSCAWKEALLEYMNRNNLGISEVAAEMIKNGISIQEITIRGWLDEDSHIVGPRKVESIQQIAILTGNSEMLNHADDYFDACSIVRKTRRRILSIIAQTVLGGLVGEEPKNDPIYLSVYEHMDGLATILQIDTVRKVTQSVPSNIINRPLNIED